MVRPTRPRYEYAANRTSRTHFVRSLTVSTRQPATKSSLAGGSKWRRSAAEYRNWVDFAGGQDARGSWRCVLPAEYKPNGAEAVFLSHARRRCKSLAGRYLSG